MAKATFHTPRGRLLFPKLRTPDQYKDPKTNVLAAPKYSTKLVLTPEAGAKVEAMVRKVMDPFLAKLREEAGKLPPLKAKKELARIEENIRPVCVPEEDREGNETGFVVVTFSTSADVTNKRTGVTTRRNIFICDANGTPLPKSIDPWSGTEAVVAFTMGEPYDKAIGIGVPLYLEAVQVLKLVKGGARDAAGYGFSQHEGYVAGEEGEEDEDEGSMPGTEAGDPGPDDSDGDY